MTRVHRFALGLLAASALGSVAHPALAEPPSSRATPVYVLSIWTDDSDDQADALTQALRSRVRQAAGWSLLETNQSFETLAIALKCPAKPDPPCLQRIADQLHADHYVWGLMSRKKGAGEVNADVHLWSRGHLESQASEPYSENLKDASDESLKQIAARLFGKLTGSAGGGTMVIRAGNGSGAVFVDGVEKATLEGGVARVDVGSGPHTISVRVPGFAAPAQQASVGVGSEQEVNFSLAPVAQPPPDTGPHPTFPSRKVIAYSAIVAGAGLLIASGVEAAAWVSDSNAAHDDRLQVPSSVTDVCAAEVNQAAQDACHKGKDAVTVSTLAWVLGGAGAALAGTGLVLLMTDPGTRESTRESGAPASSRRRVEVLPSVGVRGGTVDLRLSF
jgi:hypothetical protein